MMNCINYMITSMPTFGFQNIVQAPMPIFSGCPMVLVVQPPVLGLQLIEPQSEPEAMKEKGGPASDHTTG